MSITMILLFTALGFLVSWLVYLRRFSRYLIQINYKSGIQETLWVYNIKTKWNSDGLSQVEFLPVNHHSTLFMGIADIESIYKLKKYHHLN